MILVFKTNVKNKRQVNGIKTEIDANLPNAKWNFDLEDCDKIFRVEGDNISLLYIIFMMEKIGIYCAELTD